MTKKRKEELTLLEAGAVDELNELRGRNKLMSIRLQAIDDMLLLANSRPPSKGEGYSPDLVHEISQFFKRVGELP